MRELIIAEFITLDGVIQAPGGAVEDTDGGFAHGGWTLPYWHDDIGAHFFQAMSQADALLLGRKTWQIHGGAFEPMTGDPFGDAMNEYPQICGVHHSENPPQPGATQLLISGNMWLRLCASSSSSPARIFCLMGAAC